MSQLKSLHSAGCIDTKTGYHYEVMVHTGVWRNSGTTAHVTIVLYGSEENSQPIVLNPDHPLHTFTRAGTDRFLICVEKPLGTLHTLHVTHDNTGRDLSWFLDDITVTDVQNGDCSISECRRWMAVEKEDGNIERVLRMRDAGNSARFAKHIYSRAVTNLTEEHVWLSVVTKHPQERFTRVQRISCCLSFLYLSMLTSAMFYREGPVKDIPVTIGPVKLTTKEIFVSIASVLIVAPVNILIVLLFRKAKPNPVSFTRHDNSTNLPHSNRKRNLWTDFTLPHFCVTIAWILCILTSLASAVITVFYSLEFGADKANRLITSLLLSCVQDVFVFEPGRIFFLNIICSFLYARWPFVENEDNEITFATSGTGNRDILPVSLASEESIQRSRKYKTLKNKTYAFFREVSLYILFVIILLVFCYGEQHGSFYHMTKEIKDNLKMKGKVHANIK